MEVEVPSNGQDPLIIPNEEVSSMPEPDQKLSSSPTPITEKTDIKADVEEGQSEEAQNPYAYLERNEFSSERHKLELKNLPKQYGFKDLKKFFLKLHLNPHKIKSGNSRGQFVFVSFRSDEERDKAIEVLKGQKFKGQALEAIIASAAKDPFLQRKRNIENKGEPNKRMKPNESESNEPVSEIVKRVTSPWFDIPYEEQLEKKNEIVKDYLINLSKEIRAINPQLVKSNEAICPFQKIQPSPVIDTYRNKCEFTIGYDPESGNKTVGFRLTSYKQGSTCVGPIDGLAFLPRAMVDAALIFQKYIQNSKYEAYNPETHSGTWRQLTVRVNRKNDVMLIVLIQPQSLSSEEIETIKSEIKACIENVKEPQIKSLFFKTQELPGQKQKNVPELLLGEEYISETINGLSFRISAESFFQVNYWGTELLLRVLEDNCGLDQDTCLLDVCCGTGTIGQMLAPKCGQVLGVEIILSAVQDAKENAIRNNLQDKCTYFCGKAEDLLDAVTTQTKLNKIIAIIDPPRAGIHPKVLHVLRRCSKINTIIYVACNAEAVKRNFIDFARPISKKYKGTPFKPVLAIPVDMFPQCPYMELVVVLQRDSTETGVSNDTSNE